MTDALERLVDEADLDALVRQVDRSSDADAWDDLVRLRRLCRAALERGRQLWPIASLVEYRLALEGPAELAASVLVPDTGWMALGPLAEVAASTHRWVDLGPHVPPGPVASMAAHERAVRGEAVDPASVPEPAVLDVPLELQPWEPPYPVATYHRDRVEAPRPDTPTPRPVRLPAPAHAAIDGDPGAEALRAVVAPWAASSGGRVEVAAVAGSGLDAVAALGPPVARAVELAPADALALLAWAGASGGAHGRRRGAAAGRFEAWWALAALAGLDHDDPSADELGQAAAELRWYLWDDATPSTGWHLRLAVEDPVDGLAWAVGALDA